jgi:hypothetical protein
LNTVNQAGMMLTLRIYRAGAAQNPAHGTRREGLRDSLHAVASDHH